MKEAILFNNVMNIFWNTCVVFHLICLYLAHVTFLFDYFFHFNYLALSYSQFKKLLPFISFKKHKVPSNRSAFFLSHSSDHLHIF